MANFWDDWQKPWTKEQCRRRYVQGDDDIAIRQLAKDSGVPRATIEGWTRAEKWFEQRQTFRGKLNARIDEKVIEKIGEEVAIEISNYSKKHVEVCDTFIGVAEYYINRLLVMLRSGELSIDKLDGFKHNFMSLSLDRAINAQRAALGLEYEDVNKAMRLLKSMGYEVTEPISINAKEQSESKAKTTKGISESTAAEIRSKILGIESEDTPTLSAEVDS